MASQDVYQRSIDLHRSCRGKVAMSPKMAVGNMADLALAYTPGVAGPCRVISSDRQEIYELTAKANTVAVISDGSAVLGLGNIGPEAAIPVMEGKCVLFKTFADIDAFPLCLRTQDPDEIVKIVSALTPTLGGINLEDISAPRCFEIETRLKDACDIPVFHDDQHGTATVLLAALLNALKVTGRKMAETKIVINGAGAAGTAIALLLAQAGASDIVLCDSRGILSRSRDLSPCKARLVEATNPRGVEGTLADAVKGADVFLGTSVAGALTGAMVRSMAPDSVIFAMANPVPEIFPQEAKENGAAVVGTGRSDFPNQVNNCLGFPGIFRGALDVQASCINDRMTLAAADALAGLIPDDQLSADLVIADSFDPRVVPAVAAAVSKAARETGVARL